MKLTNNFWLDEFIESKFYDEETQEAVWDSYEKSKDILLPNIQKLANQLQCIRTVIKEPLHINISYRPLWYELLKGRSGNSQHVLGKAADLRAESISPLKLHYIIERLISEGEILQGGLGKYKTFTHYDIRRKKARW